MKKHKPICSRSAQEALAGLLRDLAGDLRIVMHGSFRYPVYPDWKKAPQLQEDMHMMYIRGGEGAYIMDDGTRIPLVRGSLVMISSDIPYRAEHDPSNPPLISGMRFGLYERGGRCRPVKPPVPFYLYVPVENHEKFDALTGTLHAVFHADAGEELRPLAPLMMHLLLYEMYLALENRKFLPAEGSRSVRSAIAYFKANVGRRMSVAEAAERAGVSVRALEKAFKSEVGMTPNAYKMMLQMDDAYKALYEQRMSVAEVAARLGYSDAFAFSRQFKKYWGVAPLSVKLRKTERN